PLLVNDKLYFGSNDGWVSIVQAGRNFHLLQSIDIGESITASLLVAQNTLLMRSSEALYAIRMK
ncbi:MAG: serine/threonine protein kinase, partial [Pirellulales bacterium]